MATEPRLEHQTFKVKQLVEDYRTGRIVFDYEWGKYKNPFYSTCRDI